NDNRSAPASILFRHAANRFARAKHRAVHVQFEQGLDVVATESVEPGFLAAPSGVVHEDVDGSEFGIDLLEHRFNVAFARNISANRDSATSDGANGRDHLSS